MKCLLAVFAGLALAMGAMPPAGACSYVQAPEEVGDTSAQFFAPLMFAAATHVDLVLVEDDGMRPMDEPMTGVITVRSIARFKGNGPDRFSLFGHGLTLQPEPGRRHDPQLQHLTLDDGRVVPFPYNEERPSRMFGDGPPSASALPLTSCSPPPLAAHSGHLYVVMRGEDGRLLGEFELYDDVRARAFGFVPATLGEDDHWLRAIRLAAFEQAEGVSHDAAPEVLHLRDKDADPARIEDALRRLGVVPVAAFVATGGWLDEIRPAAEEAAVPWLARAVPTVRQRQRGGLGDPDYRAAELLRDTSNHRQPFGDLSYEVAQAFIASVRHRQSAAGAPSRLVAVALSGPADAIAAAQRAPFARGWGPLPAREPGLRRLPGADEAEAFAAMQVIDRDLWLLNGGGGNPPGTLPQDPL